MPIDMEKPNSSQQAKNSPSITSILKIISDESALVIFNNIIVSYKNNRFISLKETNLSSKQFYSRLSGILKAGLIKRHKGKYIPTLLGRVVYDSQMIIEEAISHYWKLKAIDQIEMSHSDLPTEEMKLLINALIDNHRIKDMLMNQADVATKKQTLSYDHAVL
jgi:DNA-binding HxlR family transcriptional regulator